MKITAILILLTFILSCEDWGCKGCGTNTNIDKLVVTADKDYKFPRYDTPDIYFIEKVPYGTTEVTIKEIELGEGATSDKGIGDKLKVDTTEVIIVASKVGITLHHRIHIYSKKE